MQIFLNSSYVLARIVVQNTGREHLLLIADVQIQSSNKYYINITVTTWSSRGASVTFCSWERRRTRTTISTLDSYATDRHTLTQALSNKIWPNKAFDVKKPKMFAHGLEIEGGYIVLWLHAT